MLATEASTGAHTGARGAFSTQLCPVSPESHEGHAWAHACAQRLRQRHAGGLLPGREHAAQSTGTERPSFATGLRQDEAAGAAALAYEGSHGQVAGQINQLQRIKRQMSGRAKVDLLSVRMRERA